PEGSSSSSRTTSKMRPSKTRRDESRRTFGFRASDIRPGSGRVFDVARAAAASRRQLVAGRVDRALEAGQERLRRERQILPAAVGRRLHELLERALDPGPLAQQGRVLVLLGLEPRLDLRQLLLEIVDALFLGAPDVGPL